MTSLRSLSLGDYRFFRGLLPPWWTITGFSEILSRYYRMKYLIAEDIIICGSRFRFGSGGFTAFLPKF